MITILSNLDNKHCLCDSVSQSNNLDSNEDKTQGLSNQVTKNPQQNPSGGPMVVLEVSSNVERVDYWKTLVAELVIRIPLYPYYL